jgi:hypothetical protein
MFFLVEGNRGRGGICVGKVRSRAPARGETEILTYCQLLFTSPAEFEGGSRCICHIFQRETEIDLKRESSLFFSHLHQSAMHCTCHAQKHGELCFVRPRFCAEKQFYKQLKLKQINNFFRGGTLLLQTNGINAWLKIFYGLFIIL